MDRVQQMNEKPAGIYAETSVEVTAAGAGFASPTVGGEKSPVTDKNEHKDNTGKTATTITQEEEDLLLTPFSNLGVEDGASIGTLVDDDTCSVASSTLSRSSTTSVRSRISNCKKTIKRLGKRKWEELTANEQIRLFNARAFLKNEPLKMGGPCAQTSGEVDSKGNTGEGALMGPPNPPIDITQSKKGAIPSGAPLVREKMPLQNSKPSTSTKSSTGPCATTGLEDGKAVSKEANLEGACESSIRGHVPQCSSSITPSPSSSSGVMDVTKVSTRTVIEKNASKTLTEDRIIQRRIRNTERTIRRLSNKDPDSLTARDKIVLENATRNLKTLTLTATNKNKNIRTKNLLKEKEMVGHVPPLDPDSVAKTSKRNRQDDTLSPTKRSPLQKRKRTLAEETLEARKFAIADFGNPSRKLSEDQWQLLEMRILDEVNDAIVNSRPPPLFGNLRTIHGFKVLTCEDDHTLAFLQDFVKRTVAPWPNADLRLIGTSEISDIVKPKARMTIKGPAIPRDRVERYLQSLNTEQLSQSWKVIEMGERTEEGTEVVVQLSHKSIPLLRKIGYKVRIGINRCKLRLITNKTTQVSKAGRVFNKI